MRGHELAKEDAFCISAVSYASETTSTQCAVRRANWRTAHLRNDTTGGIVHTVGELLICEGYGLWLTALKLRLPYSPSDVASVRPERTCRIDSAHW